jgi:glycosyltransferase involved in cell wall biosynthesis
VISIIIPARNEALRIGAQLAALAPQLDADTEVIVADNGSTDGTVRAVNEWADRMPVRVVDAGARRGQAAARNIAAATARGDLLVFVDADDVVLPNYVDAWRSIDDSVAFASGPVIFFGSDEAPPRTSDRAPKQLPIQMGFLRYALGANCAVRRAVFERSGGFDETYPPSEDVELSWRLQLMGVPLTFVPDAVVAKREAATFRSTIHQYFRYGERDPYLYRDYRSRGVPAPSVGPTLKTYGGILARVPVLWRREQRRRWTWQLGRRAGRLMGSMRAGVFYP